MNKSIRIRTNPRNTTERYINVKLEQDFDTLNILSLTLKQSDIYRSFNANYGCVIGRVQSSGVGLPNCKVSVFIPIDTTDSTKPEILSIYPYTNTTTDQNDKGLLYNLLNKLKRLNPFSGFKENNYGVGYQPKTPVGSIPDKNELLVNSAWMEVYEKYYKFTTVTNESGDFMLFGVPTGSQVLHVECDSTDLGRLSNTVPVLVQTQGLPQELVNEDGTKIIPTNDLTKVPTVYRQDIPIDVKPFWGDVQTSQIGFTKQNVVLPIKLTPSFTVYGAGFTQSKESFWYDRITFKVLAGLKNLCLVRGDCDCFEDTRPSNGQYQGGFKIRFVVSLIIKAFGRKIIDAKAGIGKDKLTCDVGSGLNVKFCFYLVLENIIPFFCFQALTDRQCDINGGKFETDPFSFNWVGNTSACGNCREITNSFALLGDFTTLLNLDDCRVGQIDEKIYSYKNNVTDNDIINNYDNIDYNNDITLLTKNQYAKIESPDGTFLYQILCNRNKIITDEFGNPIPTDDPNLGVYTEFYGYIIFSMDGEVNSSGGKIVTDRTRIKVPACIDYNDNNIGWIKSAYLFKANEVYTVAQYFSVASLGNTDPERQTGILLDVNTFNQSGVDDDGNEIYGDDLEMAANRQLMLFQNRPTNVFANDWLNGCLYFIQAGYKRKKGKRKDRACSHILGDGRPRTRDNQDPLGANTYNTKFILNNRNFQTNFVHVDKDLFVDQILTPNIRRGLQIPLTLDSQTLMNVNNTTGFKYYYRGLLISSDSSTNLLNKDVI
jgi:hypothetical protein